MKKIPDCSNCHLKKDCKVFGCSEAVLIEFCPLILNARREADIAKIYNRPVVFMTGAQPIEIIDIVKFALNENASLS
jgi:hypothetical protein